MFYLAFIFGLIVGSFLNVVIYRLKTRQNLVFGGSFCPECKAQLRWYDLMPLLSFIYLRGRCRYCHKKISWQYPIVEILSGLIWLGVFWKVFEIWNLEFVWNLFGIWNLFRISDFGFRILDSIYYIFIFSALLVIAVYDFKWRIIPDKIIYPAVMAAILYNSFLVLKFGDWQNYFLNPLLTAVVLFAFLFLIFYFSFGCAMGLGDAKLAFLIGLFLSPLSAAIAFALAFIIGAAFGIILIGLGPIFPHYKKWGMKSQIAFGPFLVLGTIIAFFLSDFFNNFISFL